MRSKIGSKLSCFANKFQNSFNSFWLITNIRLNGRCLINILTSFQHVKSVSFALSIARNVF